MGISQVDMLTGLTKQELSIAVIQAYEPPAGYYLAFSGGKDSIVIYDLAVKAGVKFDAHYCVSPIDPPQIHQFIKQHYPEVAWDYHARGFWKTVQKKGALPMRQARWCCEIIKEAGGDNRIVVVGNRREEGTIRKHQKCLEAGWKHKKTFLRPILEWDSGEIWEYIAKYDLEYCSLYDEGFKRLGCVLCPFVRDVEREMRYFPQIVKLWKRAADRIVVDRLSRGNISKRGKPYKQQFETGQELFDWWVSRK